MVEGDHNLHLMGAFDDLATNRNVVVTTYKRDGTAVPTPVNVVVLGEHAYFRTWSSSGKAKRLPRNPQVLIAPSTMRGKPTGPAITATARLLGPEEEQPIGQALKRKYPVLQDRLVPLAHRLRHYSTVHYELTAE
jgi:PPOX class probable F420-dependent enzyme